MKNFLKRFAAWVIALKDRPLKSAQFKLTALYTALTFVALIIFIIVLGVVAIRILDGDLGGRMSPQELKTVTTFLFDDLRSAVIILSFFLLIAISIISYFSVRMTLRPIRAFLEAHQRFIADASHELRTPLATMRTEIDVAFLDPDSLSKEEAVQLLRSNLEEIDRMSKILTNLLNLASFNDAEGEPPIKPMDLLDAVNSSIKRAERASEGKGIVVTLKNEKHMRVIGNPTAIEEVIFNLLRNAINYSHAGGRVEISVSETRYKNSDYARLMIRDQGVGIASEELPHVFEPFYRSERSLHMHKSGSGLGLPLVKEIIRRHHGRISIESSTDRGTIITIDLPLA